MNITALIIGLFLTTAVSYPSMTEEEAMQYLRDDNGLIRLDPQTPEGGKMSGDVSGNWSVLANYLESLHPHRSDKVYSGAEDQNSVMVVQFILQDTDNSEALFKNVVGELAYLVLDSDVSAVRILFYDGEEWRPQIDRSDIETRVLGPLVYSITLSR